MCDFQHMTAVMDEKLRYPNNEEETESGARSGNVNGTVSKHRSESDNLRADGKETLDGEREAKPKWSRLFFYLVKSDARPDTVATAAWQGNTNARSDSAQCPGFRFAIVEGC